MTLLIDDPSAVANLPTPPDYNPATAGWFADRDTATGQQGTMVRAHWLNYIQGNLQQAALAAGRTVASWADFNVLRDIVQVSLAPFPQWVGGSLRFAPGVYTADNGTRISLAAVINLAAPSSGTNQWVYPVIWRNKTSGAVQITWTTVNPLTTNPSPPSGALSAWDFVIYKYPNRLNGSGQIIPTRIVGGTPRNPVIRYVNISWSGVEGSVNFTPSTWPAGETNILAVRAPNASVGNGIPAQVYNVSAAAYVPPTARFAEFYLAGSDYYTYIYQPGQSTKPLRITGGDAYLSLDTHFMGFDMELGTSQELVLETWAVTYFMMLDVRGYTVTETLP